MNTRSMARWKQRTLGRAAARLAAAGALAMLAACATAPGQAGLRPEGTGASPYGQFLAGRAALNAGRPADAARYYGAVRILDPDAAGIADERAFVAALLAGDVETAARLAPTSETTSPPNLSLSRLVRAVEGMSTGRARQVRSLLTPESAAFPHRAATALLAPWAAAMAGDKEGLLVRPQSPGDRMVDVFGLLAQARLFERTGRLDEAETNFKVLAGGDSPGQVTVLAYGGFLERRKRAPEAIALYDRLLATDPRNAPVKAARARAAAGRAEPQPTLRQGAAQTLIPVAATLIAAGQEQMGLAYLRLALRLDPDQYAAWILVGDLLDGDGLAEEARAAYARTPSTAPEFTTAQAKLAWSHQRAGDKETALRLARQSAADGDVDAVINLSDILRANEMFSESADVLDPVLASSPPDWRLSYARGVSLERAGRWPEAERDLKAALALNPDEPELLNYLGYSWIDRNENLDQALEMVRRAVSQNPRSGAMVDSLGWAYYRLGDFPQAVTTLEMAVELEPGDPELNNHLGDAYWRVGRRDEAGFQWRRVLTLDPDPKIRADAERKLAEGLAPPPLPAVRKP
ncbi:tetratricopeptide repeat protein [Phenylobacterium sp.]|uniref:tetratricopeptide repeat protein n=1 Tax=Phenylobacterium sp. TaxID=1871053 RepID=UPI0025E3E8D5|nr:tetratricopeptide repeat protein [Phenylobacterium sp.]